MNKPSGPIAKAEMLIRRPAAEVFEAFVDPAITSKFWFTSGSARLAPQARVQWTWAMYGFTIPVEVIGVEPNRLIRIKWPGETAPTDVTWTFTPHADDATFVSITNSGFVGDGDQVVKQAIESTEGFTLVLAGAKGWLEHKMQLNLVADRFPKGLQG
jgi:uncharacterized protein YndB with AHSA1/START domain